MLNAFVCGAKLVYYTYTYKYFYYPNFIFRNIFLVV